MNDPARVANTENDSVERGFTLLEIMAVVVIMGLLMGVVGTAVVGRIEQARVTTAKAQISQIESAMEFYKMDNARYPTTDQGIEALLTRPSSPPEPRSYPPGGYLKKRDAAQDPWGNDYQYMAPGQHNANSFDLWSLGADGEPGGEESDADIGNWSDDATG